MDECHLIITSSDWRPKLALLKNLRLLMVATSALGTGVDFPGIVFILHLGIPWSMIDYAQESGRGGRAGERVDPVILVEQGEVGRTMRQRSDDLDVQWARS